MNIRLEPKETEFLVNLLRQLNVSPAAPDAMSLVEVVQSIFAKLQPAPMEVVGGPA